MSTEVDAVQKARKDRKAKRKREQTAVVGDMSGMLDTLPTLELLMKQSSAASEARYAVCFLFSTHFCVFSNYFYFDYFNLDFLGVNAVQGRIMPTVHHKSKAD